MKYDIFECQPGLYCRTTGAACHDDPYVYVGPDRASGLHRFIQGSKVELFARRRSSCAGFHLKRGKSVYEFVRSAA